MADGKVLLEVVVEGKNVKVVQRQVEGVTAAVNENTAAQSRNIRATEKATKANDHFNRGLKGAAGVSSNGTKNFSKMRDAMGDGSSGLVGAYATLAANLFAATAAFEALRKAAQVDMIRQSIESLGVTTGQNILGTSKAIQELSGFALSSGEAMKAASLGFSAGFDASQLKTLTKVAKGASIALGRDLSDSYDRLIRGAAKLEPEILDELGIIVRIRDATEAYARSVGKTVDELSTYERQQGFINAINEQGIKKFGALAESLEASPYDKFLASLSNASNALIKFLSESAKIPEFLNYLSENLVSLGGAVAVFVSTISRQMLPVLYEGPMKAAQAAEVASSMAAKVAEEAKQAGNILGQSGAKLPKIYENLLPQLRAGTASIDDQKRAVTSLNKSISYYQKVVDTGKLKGVQLDPQKLEEYRQKLTGVQTELQNLNDVQTGNSNAQIAATKAKLSADSKLQASNTLLAASSLSLGQAINGLKLSFIAYRAEVTLAGTTTSGITKIWATVRAGALTTALAVRALGAAFLALLPWVGLLLSFGPMLYDWAKNKFFPETEMEKKQKIIEELKSSTDEFFSNLTKTTISYNLDFQTTGLDRAIQGLGIFTNTLSDLITTLQESTNKAKTSAIQLRMAAPGGADYIMNQFLERSKELAKKRQELVDIEGTSGNIFDIPKRTEIARLSSEIDTLRKSYIEAYQEAVKLGNADAEPFSLVKAISDVTKYKELIKAENIIPENLRPAIIEKLDAAMKEGTSELVISALGRVRVEYENLKRGLEGIPEQVGKVSDALGEFGKGQDTAYTPIIKELETLFTQRNVLENQVKRLGETTVQGKAAAASLSMVEEKLQQIAKEQGYTGGTKDLQNFLATAKAADRLDRTLASSKDRYEALKEVSSSLMQYPEVEVLLKNEYLSLLDSQIEKDRSHLALMIASGKADESAIQSQRDLIASKEAERRIEEQNSEVKQKQLEMDKKIFLIQKATADANLEAQRNRLMLQSPTGELSTRDEDQLIKQQFVERKSFLLEELNLKIQGVNIEKDMLMLRLETLRNELKSKGRLNQETESSLERIKDSLNDMPTLAIKQATAEYNRDLSNLQVQLKKASIDLSSKVQVSLGSVMGKISETFYEDIKNTVPLVDQLAYSFSSAVDAAADSFVDAIIEGKNIFNSMKEALRTSLLETIADASKSQLKLGVKLLFENIPGFDKIIPDDPARQAAEASTSVASSATAIATTLSEIPAALASLSCTCTSGMAEMARPSSLLTGGEGDDTLQGASSAIDDLTTETEKSTGFLGGIFTKFKSLIGLTEKGNKEQSEGFSLLSSGIGQLGGALLSSMGPGIGKTGGAIGGTLMNAGLATGNYWLAGAGAVASFLGFEKGGIMSSSGPMPLEKYAKGGIARTPQLAMFGEGSRPEAYVPLPDGRSIPVTMSNGGGNVNNISVNVAVDGSGSATTNTTSKDTTEDYSRRLGTAISNAVKQEIFNQQRPGGLLYKGRR